MPRRETPIKKYTVAGRTVFVKRDDLYARWPAPPVAKLRGLEVLLPRLKSEGRSLVGCFEARVSTIGQGVAAVCSTMPGMKCVVAYPEIAGRSLTPSLAAAKELGAELLPVPSNVVNVCYGQARQAVERRGGFMIPFGFECPEALVGVEMAASSVHPRFLQAGTLVLCCGSGVTLAGLIRGLPVLPSRIVGVSSGRSLQKIRACLKRNCDPLPDRLELHEATVPYSMAAEAQCPFPCNAYYDLKAWLHLVRHVKQYQDPILFWNIGA